jgi:NAD(P)-dependent dehydrogenase (short-subunit alcohol dehydrogenase family)
MNVSRESLCSDLVYGSHGESKGLSIEGTQLTTSCRSSPLRPSCIFKTRHDLETSTPTSLSNSMTDAQHFFDLARAQVNSVAADVERHFDLVASHLREWIPSDPSSLVKAQQRRLPPPTYYEIVTRWIDKNRALTAAIVGFAVTGVVSTGIYVQNRKANRKRRARKSSSGARVDVVVVAGATSSPLASAVALDLERRGFVVYVATSSVEEEMYIRSLSRADLLPLPLALADPFAAQEQLSRFQHLLGREHVAFDGAEPHHLEFKGLILVPDTGAAPVGNIGGFASEEWSDMLNAKVLNTIATTQLFLPALIEHQSKILMLTPSITPALQLPGHAAENTIYAALRAFASTLAAEMSEQNTGVIVSQFKLGNFDIPSVTAKQRRDGQPTSKFKATPLRELNNTVFDTLMARKTTSMVRVGRGSLTYDIVGALAPQSIIGWMLGLGKRQRATVVSDLREELSGSQASLTWEKIEDEA